MSIRNGNGNDSHCNVSVFSYCRTLLQWEEVSGRLEAEAGRGNCWVNQSRCISQDTAEHLQTNEEGGYICPSLKYLGKVCLTGQQPRNYNSGCLDFLQKTQQLDYFACRCKDCSWLPIVPGCAAGQPAEVPDEPAALPPHRAPPRRGQHHRRPNHRIQDSRRRGVQVNKL